LVTVSPTIRIDNEVFDKLKESAEPFVDTPNTVLRRILGLSVKAEIVGVEAEEQDGGAPKQSPAAGRKKASRHKKRPRAPRARAGTILPDAEYEIPILSILEEHGGRAPTREVIDALGQQLDGRLTDVDHARLSSGEIRWRNRAQFVRLGLIERGDMIKGSPRGVWEISDQGRGRLTETRSQ
jgi:Mrr N-terminal domain